jgi:hypothetical protein
MVADAKIIDAWNRASGPISRYFDFIEALARGEDERQIVRGLRCLDKDLSSAGIRSDRLSGFLLGIAQSLSPSSESLRIHRTFLTPPLAGAVCTGRASPAQYPLSY